MVAQAACSLRGVVFDEATRHPIAAVLDHHIAGPLNKWIWSQQTAATGTSSERTGFLDQPLPISGSPMKQSLTSFLLALTVSTSFAMAQPVGWTKEAGPPSPASRPVRFPPA